MKNFEKFIIIDWYDNIIKAFFIMNERRYYSSLVFQDIEKEEYIYICISLDFFVESEKIIHIIESDKIKENWEQFYVLLNNVHSENKSFLVKTQNLQFGTREVVKYKNDINWNNDILFSDYPDNLDIAKKNGYME
jgi:hypothetical protein